jgi:hypothetical protein
VQQLP